MGARITSIRTTSVAADSADVATPSSNTAAVVTYAAGINSLRHVISGIAWSYSGSPTGGNLKIEDGVGNTVLSMDVAGSGPGILYFDPFKVGLPGTALVITLAAGGSGVSGKVSVLAHWTE